MQTGSGSVDLYALCGYSIQGRAGRSASAVQWYMVHGLIAFDHKNQALI